MPFGQSHGQAYLNGKDCFDFYLETGSWRKAAAKVAEQMSQSSDTPRPYRLRKGDDTAPSAPGVENAGKRWAVANPEEAFDLLKKYTHDEYYVYFIEKPSAFYRTLLKYAKSMLSPEEYESLLATEPYSRYVKQAV